MYLSYNDVSIIPRNFSNIHHREECYPYLTDFNIKSLPIFTAPMSCIVLEENLNDYINNNITPILPRNIPYDVRIKYMNKGYWVAMSLEEFNETEFPKISKVCVDVANGHMMYLYDCINAKKEKYPKLVIMTGNVANPNLLDTIVKWGSVDYIRLGIGGGSGCITSSNTGIHCPMASLIHNATLYRYNWNAKENKNKIKIIADGGIRNYSDVIKALALGANYVMIGSLFSQCYESNKDEIYYKTSDGKYKHTRCLDGDIYHKFYGMASKQGQIDLFGEKKHTAEGIAKYLPIKYTLKQWTDNMKDYLQSAMSYCNAKNLEEFYENSKIIDISNNSYLAINK